MIMRNIILHSSCWSPVIDRCRPQSGIWACRRSGKVSPAPTSSLEFCTLSACHTWPGTSNKHLTSPYRDRISPLSLTYIHNVYTYINIHIYIFLGNFLLSAFKLKSLTWWFSMTVTWTVWLTCDGRWRLSSCCGRRSWRRDGWCRCAHPHVRRWPSWSWSLHSLDGRHSNTCCNVKDEDILVCLKRSLHVLSHL